ncbi:collagen alpha-1(I) chain-like [Agelaius tricolor]|uniref:collagen alpha-1(I) chain-like n=1 Tax=Agelaius tricolor TaxID=9191 RepID=UPI0039F240B8
MPPRTRGRAPGFRDRTSTRKTGGKKRKKTNPLSEGRPRGGGARAPDRLPPRGETPTSPTPSFGGGPGARARPGLRAEGRAARAGRAGGTGRPARFSLSRDDAHNAHGTRPGARGRRPPRRAGSPLGPDAAGLARSAAAPPRGRRCLSSPHHHTGTGLSPGLETGTRRRPAQPAGTPPAGPLPRRAGGRATGGRAPPPAPEAGATESRAGVACARGLPDGRPGRRRGGNARHRRRRLAPPGPLASGTRPAGRATEARRRAEPGTGPPPADGGRRPADRPRREGHPSSGAAAARHGVARARGPPPPEGPPSARPPPTGGRGGRARGRPADDGAAAPRLRGRKGRRGEERRRTRRTRRRRARQRPRRRAQERERGRAPAAVAPRPRKGQRARALCRASPVTTRRAGRPPRPTARRGLSAEAGPRRGGGRAPLPGAARLTPPAARGGDDDDDGRDGGARPVATGQPPQGIGGSSCSPPLRGAPHGHRPRHTPAAAAAAAATAAATAGHAEPPESLNRRPAPPAPLSAQPAAFDDAEGKKTWGGPPRRRALGTWPWGEGNDLHGPAGVPPPLPPSGERPPAGARPTSAATTATSFSGPGVSLSSPALRAREDRRGSGRPAGAGDTRARPPSTTSGARARHPARPGTPGGLGPRTSSAAREKGGRSARERDTLPRPAKAPAAPRCGKGRRSRLLRGPEGAPATRLPRPFGQAAREGDGRASGRGRAEHPSLPAPGRPISRATPRREPSSGELGPRRQGGPHARRRPAFGGAGRSGERLGGPRPRAPPLSGGDGPAADRRKAGAAGRCTGRGGGAQAAATAAGAPRFEARPRRAV